MAVSKCTPDVEAKLMRLISAGCAPHSAASAMGIPKSTFYRWMQAAAFRDKVELARGASQSHMERVIGRAAANGSWKAALVWLERNFPEEWAKREKVEHTVEETVTLKHDYNELRKLPADELLRLHREALGDSEPGRK